ncbi:ribosome biogenesis protein BOP1 homolog isoform X1 [Benincasa hispida]|uniref:ribosome biogenesis protein BOP1 homolog isoform X1 n=1 Tax=Benincasa hispida TaxID=102211 RepID=UPI00190048B0|nr:ribosome biogenesis protein BOP1 homolog isoform X1 [Benincasa hispida]XP_038889805.1 ribosome biogenesis protein BOP1 homolog isoform X1 [Benincasa hispida]XP_038889806.1 ribosome biogenesis protein BOP1 homolog isoform X1 [Benincasa hispida]XP_038889807.1 ribosome biogenesis protein BOP1 homolog isoform X1 [Benincasa hispida]XP_038889808.1 ribosome biogenesis protein BOP1 homolog isoform X1 [Benincasa hispida]XP_038889810.1 ribosome biogenesis protein BOP1 homolog isoform X1 [Benincasa hi
MKLKIDSKSLQKTHKLQKKHGTKKSHVDESQTQSEKQNNVELHLEQEAPTLDEAPLQQHSDSAPPFGCNEQDHVNAGDNHGNFENDHDQENENDNPIPDPVDEESDSSEDEVAPRNTIGDVPLEWYRDEKHIGYDISGKKILKKEREDRLQSFLASADDSKSWRKVYDEYNDEVIELSKEEVRQLRKLLKGKAPHADFDPYESYVDWFKWDDAKHPLSNAPEPKRRFIRSKWEAKKVVRLVRAIRNGHIKFEKPKEEQRFYNLWGDDSSSTEKTTHLSYIPAPKPKLPGHDESYNPSLEYIPTQEEINSYQLMYEEDRPKFIPRRFTSMRSVPAYDNALKDAFERCLDLYLCPRVRKKRINIDPESLKPKLPNRKDLKPYPTTCYLEYRGHKDAVMSISTEANGQWIASGSLDGTVRIWEVETGRCLKVWELGEAVKYVAWNPKPELPVLAAAVGVDVLLLNTGFGDGEVQAKIKEVLHVDKLPVTENSDKTPVATWLQDDKIGGIRLRHFKTVSAVEWHRKGDYLSTVMPAGESRAILIHQLSTKLTQKIPFKLRGLPVSSVFHPTQSILFVSTKTEVRVYNLLKQKLMKKLKTGLREVSSIAVHPAGDNVIVGSREGKLCWFDMDLSSQPYKILSCHPKDITNVAFHRSRPLFASCSDDGTAYVFHGMVYSDLTQNPLITPLEILRGHKNVNGRGVMDCKFHPMQPWLFTAGADSVIKLYCH